MTHNEIPYEARRNPDLPWGYWVIAEEGKPGIRDELGREWPSLRSYLWFDRLGMGGSSRPGLEEQHELLLAVLAAVGRCVVAVEGITKDLFLGGWEAARHYECWLVGHRLVKNGLSGGLTPEGHAILVMLASTRSAKAAPIPIGLPTIAPVRALDWGESREERERVFAANEAFALGLPNRFERAETLDRPAIRLLGYPEGPNVPMARVLWSLTFGEDHDRDRFYAWLVNRIDRWQDWRRSRGAKARSNSPSTCCSSRMPTGQRSSRGSKALPQQPHLHNQRAASAMPPALSWTNAMRTPLMRDIPERMVVLSILPPPAAHQPPRPFGWGSLTVTAGRRGHASFASVSHAYGARYPADRMRRDLACLFRPDDATLVYLPVPVFNHYDRAGRLIWPRDHERTVPKAGSRNMSVVAIPYLAISDAAAAAQVTVPAEFPTPLSRLLRISAEAQAAWVYWLYSCCSRHLRRQLLASFAAWQGLERVKRSSI